MKKSPLTKVLVIIVLVFFLLSTGLMFVLYLASPSTVRELQDTNNTTQESMENELPEEQIVDETLIEEDEEQVD